jgi:uncharacterized protein involved in exopolysaccharide biosynthesis
MSDGQTDFRKSMASYVAILQRAIGYWKWGFCLCLVVTVAGTIFAGTRRKFFTSSTRIRVVSAQVDRMSELMGSADAMRDLDSRLKQFVGSRRFLQEVVDEFGLYREEQKRQDLSDGEVLALMRMRLDYGVYQGDEFGMAFTDYSPRLAQAVTKNLAQRFMEREKGADYAVYQTKLSRVETQLKRVEGQLSDMLDRETQFKQQNSTLLKRLRRRQLGSDTLDVADVSVSSSETRVTSGDSPRLRSLRRRLKNLEDTANRLRTQRRTSANTGVGAERAAVNQQVDLATRDYERLRQQYTEEWPDVRAAKRRLDQLRARQRDLEAAHRDLQAKGNSGALATVNDEIEALREQIRTQARRETAAAKRAKAPGKTVAPEQEEQGKTLAVANVEELEAALQRMETEMRPVREQVQALHADRLKLQFQTRQREQGSMEYVVVDPANRPVKASGPPRTLMALASAAAGLALGLSCMALLGFLDSRVYRPTDLARFDRIPLLAVVPDFESDINEIATADIGQEGGWPPNSEDDDAPAAG